MARSKRVPHCRLMLVEDLKPGMMVSNHRTGRDRYVNLNTTNQFNEIYSANPQTHEGQTVIALRVWAGGSNARVRRIKTGSRVLVRLCTRTIKRQSRRSSDDR